MISFRDVKPEVGQPLGLAEASHAASSCVEKKRGLRPPQAEGLPT